ncbi:hypothetical protein DHEL01_v211797 [Diaporthe helianthi]|uniref:Xylanolytic transcriptional activator regulatory domain-containing protein n=1 Tax=Diaporthe helianthi TaxID=158607 RepID=A0A2P5HHS7_DIAHE|nr:hypothetical protein DHEL01_v211797 [Diaporthe helianthi]
MDRPQSSSAASALGAPGRRRNGRLQACEPCHALKWSPSINVLSDPPDSRNHTSETGPGYLGFTSFSAVYQETQNSLSLVKGPLLGTSSVTTTSPQVSTSKNGDTGTTTVVLSPRSLETSLTVLNRIPVEEDALLLFAKHANPNDGWIRLAAKRVLESLFSVFGRTLRTVRLTPGKAKDLEDMAHLLSSNSAKPLPEDELDSEAWVSSFSGLNLRWECLGILFTYWALGALADHAHRPDLLRRSDQRHAPLTSVYKETADICAQLCRGCPPNSLLLYSMYKASILESMFAGDAAPSFWRLHGENVALVTYLGLHALHDEKPYVPTAAKEARRRLFSQLFVIDKVAASFSGRPPLLSRKYMLTPLPLDLSDEILMSDPETIAKAVGELDEDGWNRRGERYASTIGRARRKLARVKDEVMEVALGNPAYTSVEALLALKEHEYDAFEGIPEVLKYSPDVVRDPSIPAPDIYIKILVRLEHLQNLFFITRLLVQRGHDSNAELLNVSFEMVSVTLVFWTRMDRLAGLHGDFEWLVMAFAAPSGGVLCNELLNPSLQHTPVPGVTRSGIIQQLSLLSGFLDWVSPSAPNGDLCSSCKAVIQHVLDYALNVPPAEPLIAAPENAFDFNLDFSSDIDAINGHFNFDLLNTFHFEAPGLMGSSQELES